MMPSVRLRIVRRASEVQVHQIAAKSILNRVRGMPFAWSINPYQGCAHQCVFCYARATHAYRELDGVNEWGSEIFAKVNAAAVLRRELSRPGWRNDAVAVGTATDPYQPAEGRYRITRAILSELCRARTPMHLITRSGLILRDLDVLQDYARRAPVSICISLPTLDAGLARELEPTVASPRKRLATVQRLAAAGIRVGVAVAPVLPGLTDDISGLEAVVRAAAEAGASDAWHGALNLGAVTRDAFFAYLDDRRPELVKRYARMYQSKYPPAAYVREVTARFSFAATRVSFNPPPPITPDVRWPDLRLFDEAVPSSPPARRSHVPSPEHLATSREIEHSAAARVRIGEPDGSPGPSSSLPALSSETFAGRTGGRDQRRRRPIRMAG